MRDADLFLKGYAPVTTNIAFFEMPFKELTEICIARKKWVNENAKLPWEVKVEETPKTLEEKLAMLLPLTNVRPTKTLICETASKWTAFFPNSFPSGVPVRGFVSPFTTVFPSVIKTTKP